MSRRWMLIAGIVAILALIVGAAVGRSIIPSTEHKQLQVVRFKDAGAGLSLEYPATWRRLTPRDGDVRLLAGGVGVSVLLRVSDSPIDTVRPEALSVVRPLTDDLIAADQRATMLSKPVAVSLDGLLGYRYRYSYTKPDGGTGAHVHYFLFRRGKLIQLVFQTESATALPAAEPMFARVAGTVRDLGG